MDSFFKNDKNLKWVRRLVFISVPVVVLVFVFLYSISGITKFPVQVKMTGKHSFISDERIQIVERHAKMNTVLENGASIITITSPKIRNYLSDYNKFISDSIFYSKLSEETSTAGLKLESLIRKQSDELESFTESRKSMDRIYSDSLVYYINRADSINRYLLQQSEKLYQRNASSQARVSEQEVRVFNSYIENLERLYQLQSHITQFRIEPLDYSIRYQNLLESFKNHQKEFSTLLHQVNAGLKEINEKIRLEFGEFSLNKSSITLHAPAGRPITLSYLNSEEYTEEGRTVYAYKDNSDYYFEAKILPETRAKISEGDKARVLFTYNSFIDINFIEGEVMQLSTTADKSGYFLIGIIPENDFSSKKLLDQLTGTAFVF